MGVSGGNASAAASDGCPPASASAGDSPLDVSGGDALAGVFDDGILDVCLDES